MLDELSLDDYGEKSDYFDQDDFFEDDDWEDKKP